jgi:two-component system chemotaxis sensor kinase CheA
MIDLHDESLQLFLEESREHLETLERELLVLEAQRGTPEPATINSIFRAAHSIKGTASFFALVPITQLAHSMESVLGRIRAGEVAGGSGVFTALLEATSRLAQMIEQIESVDGIAYVDLIARLAPWVGEPGVAFPTVFAPAPAAPPEAAPALGPDDVEVLTLDGERAFAVTMSRIADAQRAPLGGRFVHYAELEPRHLGELGKLAATIAQTAARNDDGEEVVRVACATVLDADEFMELLGISSERVRPILDCLVTLAPPAAAPTPAPTAAPALRPTPVAVPAAPPAASPAAPPAPPARAVDGANTIRVNVVQLDRLMSLAGELVLTRNALLKKATERDLEEMIALSQRVDAITSDLQDGIMATRMQQVGTVFTKFRRIVRDLALALHKKIDLEIEGEEVELDKTIIEAIGDPLAHLVRNSCDHGLEPPAERLTAGKPEGCVLAIRARHEAGQVVIEVSDDGRGIDPQRIGRKAIEKGLRTREQVEQLSHGELIRLVFEPGFSTAEKVTDISGRGVGMDVVVSSLARIGGTVDIRSEVGRGTTITIRLPLTLAIIASILVGTAGERFAIPQVNLVELVRISAADMRKRIERVGSASVMRLRGELLPLLRLSDALGFVRSRADDATGELAPERRGVLGERRTDEASVENAERRSGRDRRATPLSAINVAVVSSGNFRYGLVVDQLLDSEEIVVKPLGMHLRANREYAGATILGDGTVALILDVAGLSAVANLGATQALIERAAAKLGTGAGTHDAHTYFVFENGPGERFAMPLGIVSRVERIAESSIVRVGGRRTVTFADTMLALVAIEDVARVSARVPGRHFYAVICKAWGREVGVMASHIVDVVEATATIDSATHVQQGIIGSTIVDGGVLLLLDVHGLVEAALPEYKKVPTSARREGGAVVLVVEDSPFFRKQIVACLHDAGYATLAAEDGAQGLALLGQHAERIALVVTDIEMPNMDGLEMTRRIRSEGRHARLPIIAVTSMSGEVAERRGRDAGLTEYLIKLDREQLIERTNHFLKSAEPVAIEAPARAFQGALG